MKYYTKRTSKSSYLKNDLTIFSVKRSTENGNIGNYVFMDIAERKLPQSQLDAINRGENWHELGEFDSDNEAFNVYVKEREEYVRISGIANKAKKEAEEELDKLEAELWAILRSLKVIPLTKENLRIMLTQMNKENWGSWDLPNLPVGYRLNQYHCDGKLATAIQLDEPFEGETRYVHGAPRGHLTNYKRI